MKNYIYITLFILGSFALTSCFDDDPASDAFGEGPSFASFEVTSKNVGLIADGRTGEDEILMKVYGPSLRDLSGTVSVDISVDPSSTAVEGTHFSLPETSISLSANNNFLGVLPITILSNGVVAPLDEDPVLVLNVSSASGNSEIIPNGKQMVINFLYLCSSDLGGTYDVTTTRDGAPLSSFTDVVVKTADGQYRTGEVGHWPASALGGTPGYTFLDVCNVLTVPQQDLVDLYSNQVIGLAGKSYADPDTDELHIEYGIYSSWESEYVYDYTNRR